MSAYERMLACVLSGQMSEREVAAAFEDPQFAAYYRQRVRNGR